MTKICAVCDECVNARIKLAFMSNEERTAQCARVSSTVTSAFKFKFSFYSISSASRIFS